MIGVRAKRHDLVQEAGRPGWTQKTRREACFAALAALSHLDRVLGPDYYQFTYLDSADAVTGRAPVPMLRVAP